MFKGLILFIGSVFITECTFAQTPDSISTKDSLVLKWGNLIEYNPNPSNLKFKSLFYRATGCMGKCAYFNIAIDSLGFALFEAKRNNQSICRGTYKQKLSNETLTELNDIINYIDLANLKDKYRISMMTDLPNAAIDVGFQNGESKSVSDVGKNGTKGLGLLHDYMLELCYTGSWENTQECQLPCDSLISRKELIEIKQLCPNGCLIPYSVDSIISYRIIIQDDDEIYWRAAAYRTPCLSRYYRLKNDFRKANRVTIDKLMVRNNGIIEEIDGWSYIVE